MYNLIKDFAGPAATIIAAVTALLVTAYFARQQRDIAMKQADTASEKLRYDLFERRYSIFIGMLSMYEAILSWKGTPAQIEVRDQFLKS